MKAKKKPRVYDAKFKQRAVGRLCAGENVSALARELGIRRKLLYDWKQVAGRGWPWRRPGRPRKTPTDPTALTAGVAQRVAELERLVGRLTLENRFFRGALQNVEELRRAPGGSSRGASSAR
jgi:transposase